jgi:hypothetical protein
MAQYCRFLLSDLGPSVFFVFKSAIFRFVSSRISYDFRPFFVPNARCIAEKGPFPPPSFDEFSVIFGSNTFRSYLCNF